MHARAILIAILMIGTTFGVLAQEARAQTPARTEIADCILVTNEETQFPHTASATQTGLLTRRCGYSRDEVSLGGIRFEVLPGETSVRLSSSSNPRVWTDSFARYYVLDAQGVILASNTFCSQVDVPLPAGARGVWFIPFKNAACPGTGRSLVKGDDQPAAVASVWATFTPANGAMPIDWTIGMLVFHGETPCHWELVANATSVGHQTWERRVCERPTAGQSPQTPTLPGGAPAQPQPGKRYASTDCVLPAHSQQDWGAWSALHVPVDTRNGYCGFANEAVARGGARFSILPGERYLNLTVIDPTDALHPSGRFWILAPGGQILQSRYFCEPTVALPIPQGAISLWVLPFTDVACQGPTYHANANRFVHVRADFAPGAGAEDTWRNDKLLRGETPCIWKFDSNTIASGWSFAREQRICKPTVGQGQQPGATCLVWMNQVCVRWGSGGGGGGPYDLDSCYNNEIGARIEDESGRALGACLHVGANGSPQLPPGAGVTPPGLSNPGETGFEGCPNMYGGPGLGATILVYGNGATVCADVATGNDGRALAIDLSPCPMPRSVDPRVDVLGYWVAVCFIVGAETHVPTVSPGGVTLPPTNTLTPSTTPGACYGSTTGLTIHWLGETLFVCGDLSLQIPSPRIDSRDCYGNALAGRQYEVGGWQATACVY